jgi:hypothetical protein
VRIDRSDVADGSGGAHVASVRSAPDDPDAAGKDQGKAVGDDGPSDSSRASADSALRIERTAAYHAAVDSAYRQYAIDHGLARVEKLECETSTPAMRRVGTEDSERHQVPDGTTEHGGRMPDRSNDFYVVAQLASGDAYHSVARTTPVLVHDANGPGYATIGTAAEYVLTGARGPASGREFEPETAGGPIQQLDAGKERISNEGVQEATAHLQRFTGGGPLEAPEQAMLDRLASIAAGDMKPTSYDLNFYTHELDEADRYARLGLGPESGVDIGSPEMYDVWNDVHTAALEDYGISGADLFYPGLAP